MVDCNFVIVEAVEGDALLLSVAGLLIAPPWSEVGEK